MPIEYHKIKPLDITEHPKRTLVKMITYRLAAWIITVPFTYSITGSWESAMGGSAVLHVALAALYYVHERIWTKIYWGRN